MASAIELVDDATAVATVTNQRELLLESEVLADLIADATIQDGQQEKGEHVDREEECGDVGIEAPGRMEVSPALEFPGLHQSTLPEDEVTSDFDSSNVTEVDQTTAKPTLESQYMSTTSSDVTTEATTNQPPTNETSTGLTTSPIGVSTSMYASFSNTTDVFLSATTEESTSDDDSDLTTVQVTTTAPLSPNTPGNTAILDNTD